MNIRKALQIANSINLIAKMPDGDALVHILGNGDESTNIDALSHWIQSQVDLLSIEKADYMLEKLVHRLHNRLSGFNSFLGKRKTNHSLELII